MNAVNFLIVHLVITVCLRLAYRTSRLGETDSSQPKQYCEKALVLLILAYVVYISFSVFRGIGKEGLGGMDARNYRIIFNKADCGLLEYFSIRSNMAAEPGFRILMWIVYQICPEYRIFLFLVHTFMFVSVCNFVKYCRVEKESPFSFLATFLLCGELFYVFCIMRNSMAVACGMWMFALLGRKKYRLAWIPMLLAISLHFSGIILVPVFFLVLLMDKRNAFTLKRSGLWLAGFLAAESLLMPVLYLVLKNTRYLHYYEANPNSVAWGTFVIVFVFTVCFILFFRKKQDSFEEHADMWIVLSAWLCLPLQLSSSIFYRCLTFFSPMYFKITPPVCKKFYDINDKRILPQLVRWVGILAIGGYFLIRAYKMYTVDFVSYGLYPHQWM